MVWHIFKKDWKLLWTFVASVALVHWISVVIMHQLGLFGENPMLEMLEDTVPMLAYFGSMFLIVAIVHLDVLPGVRQDWLVRPISRRALLLEKFLFVISRTLQRLFVPRVPPPSPFKGYLSPWCIHFAPFRTCLGDAQFDRGVHFLVWLRCYHHHIPVFRRLLG